MMQVKWLSTWLMVGVAATALIIIGCAGTQSAGYTPQDAPDVFDCVADNKLDKEVATEAELAEFSCSFKKWEGADTLHFKVAIKNVSGSDQRYRVNIFLDNGKAVGGLIPRKTAKGLVKPGQTASFVYPVKGMAQQPKAVTLRIRTIQP